MDMGDEVLASIPDGVDAGMAKNLWSQMQEFWINPELERRKATGTLPEGFSYGAVQILIDGVTGGVEVLFNHDIRIVASVAGPAHTNMLIR